MFFIQRQDLITSGTLFVFCDDLLDFYLNLESQEHRAQKQKRDPEENLESRDERVFPSGVSVFVNDICGSCRFT
jgi:hypothetical protein